MGTTSKRHKLIAEQQLESPNEEDRISNLPGCVIGYILSFLPTKDAVATSVLSSIWKDFWPLVTRLSFDDYLLLRPESKNSFERLKAEFVHFVYRVLLMGRFSAMETFSLQCSQSYNVSCVNAWLDSVVKSNVRGLDVNAPLGKSVVLPRNLFTCTTLVKLNLGGVFMSVPESSSVWLPCLKVVALFHVEFPDDDSITRLLGGCPVLDHLMLKRCMGRNVSVIKISVPSLTSLTLEFLRRDDDIFLDGQHHLPKFHIVLNTPSLLGLYIKDNIYESYVSENPHQQQLTMACFILRSPLGRNLSSSLVPFEDVHHVAVHDLLKAASKVETLYFYTEGINRCELLPKYDNLTDLAYIAHRNVTFDLLHKLLGRSPKLNFLSLKFNHEFDATSDFHKIDDDDGGSLEWDLPSRRVPDCLMFHLQIVEILNFEVSNKEVELVKYLLKNARVLEKLTIDFRCKDEHLKICDLLERFPTASKDCQVEFS